VKTDGAINPPARVLTVRDDNPSDGTRLGLDSSRSSYTASIGSSLAIPRRVLSGLVWTVLVLLCPVEAHPVDEVVQGAYLTLAPGQVLLELDVTPGSKVAGTVLKALDANGDRTVTDAESRAYAGRVLAQSSLTLDGMAVTWTLNKVSVPPYQNLETGNGILKLYAIATRPERTGTRTLSYQNRYQPVKSQWTANVFLQPAVGWQYQVTGQQRSDDGRQLTVKYTTGRS
jgi:hypothetical protein